MRQAPKGPLLEVIAVVGPTASGKTDLAVELARALGGEIVSADSRQVYRLLDAGTAKPVRDARGLVEGVPYHLVDAADPSEPFDAGRYAREAGAALAAVRGRGHVPIVAGGTGLYVRALLEGLSEIPATAPEVRARLQKSARERGRAWLHERLREVDPVAAAKIPANNIQRTMRALEVYESCGKPISSFWKKEKTPAAGAAFLSIEWPAAELKARIEARARIMWPAMLAEVRALLGRGFSGAEPGFLSLGYREAVACARGELSTDEGFAKLLSSTNQYAKRQRTWFRHQTPGAAAIRGGTRAEMLNEALEALSGASALAR